MTIQSEAELDRLLALWVSARRLRSEDLATVRAEVLARVTVEADASASTSRELESGFDPDWLWSLLKPVTRLIESSPGAGDDRLADAMERWLRPLTGDRAYRPYLLLT